MKRYHQFPHTVPPSPMTRAQCMEKFYTTPVYAITDEALSAGRTNTEVVSAMLRAGVTFLQYREKEKIGRDRLAECLALREMAHAHGCVFLVNDYVDLALAVDADGVHIGQEDMPPTEVRRLIGPDKILGLSTKNEAEYEAAVAINAEAVARGERPVIDYVGVGPVYATATKKDAAAPVGLDYVAYCAERNVLPFVAIGGIKTHNLSAVKQAGAPCVVIISELTQAPDIEDTIRKIGYLMHDHR